MTLSEIRIKHFLSKNKLKMLRKNSGIYVQALMRR